MKHRPPELADGSGAARRKRGLSEEERQLWESVARQVKPLRKSPRQPRPHASETHAPPAAAPGLTARPVSPVKVTPPPRPQPPPLVSIGRRERAQLSRGKKEIEARIDLHGMTQTRAHRALFNFLQRAHLEGFTFVLVITGKGKLGGESERGVLRRQVPQWLSLPEFRSMVVGFEQAHIGHGGEGAIYVRVRRARS
jgi:DNA-nicking Smr family endonuclease